MHKPLLILAVVAVCRRLFAGLWNQAMVYVAEPGTFHVYVGSNSTAELAGTFAIIGGRP